MASFNYYLLCSFQECQEGKNFKVSLHKYSDDGDSLLTVKLYYQFDKI